MVVIQDHEMKETSISSVLDEPLLSKSYLAVKEDFRIYPISLNLPFWVLEVLLLELEL